MTQTPTPQNDHHHVDGCCGHDHSHDHDPDRHVCRHHSLAEHDAAVDAICVDRVSFSYGSGEVLRDVTLHIESGCNLGIIGPNGGGKTTLLKIILGLINGYSGTVTVAGMSPKQVCRRGNVVGYVPQHHHHERRFPVTARQVARMGLIGKTGILHRHSREDLDHVENMLDRVGVRDMADRPIGALSGGQQQRVFIARALAAGPSILMLDEPTVGIDVPGQKKFAELIHRLHDELKLTIVIVSHDLRSVAASCGKVACLARTVHYHDSPDGLTPQLLHEVFDHDIAPIFNT